MRDGKEIFLNGEGDGYFRRNKDSMESKVGGGNNIPCSFVTDFLYAQKIYGRERKILEVGCSIGHNLEFFRGTLDISCYGIEPSLEAVNYGNEKYTEITLMQGASDELPFQDNKFDVVMMGFCLYTVDRKYLFRSVSEADRVLKNKGFLVVHDFDTTHPYKRKYKHNEELFTYKMNYAELFLANPQYYLVEKRSFSELGEVFTDNMQDRRSLQILYKDCVENAYIFEN